MSKQGSERPLRRRIVFVFIGMLFTFGVLTSCQQGETAKDVAEQFMEHISAGESEEAYELLDADMQDSIEIGDLSYIWTALEMASGENESLTYDKTEEDGANEVVFIDGVFAEGDITFLITVNENQEVAGYTVV